MDALCGLNPEYSRDQLSSTWRRTIKPTSGLQNFKIQESTKDRSGAITESAQRFYFNLVDEVMKQAERLSAPNEDANGTNRRLWRHLAKHFVFNLDEANHQASSGADTIVADGQSRGGRKKKEKNTTDSRLSITAVECGNAAGDDGPSVYLLEGKEIPASIKGLYGNSKYLQRCGAPANSFVVMTPSAFMTNEAWDDMAEALGKGIREVAIVRDHPEWWVVLHLDGYKSHVMTLKAQQILREHRILVMKENSQSSQINQAFDQTVAKNAKSENRLWYFLSSILLI